ncbi:MAG: hypothetical protein QOI36_5134 [Pseudonocardiales bacterium]|nr:hypothetical protein [Pseudonocardiales bacterium]
MRCSGSPPAGLVYNKGSNSLLPSQKHGQPGCTHDQPGSARQNHRRSQRSKICQAEPGGLDPARQRAARLQARQVPQGVGDVIGMARSAHPSHRRRLTVEVPEAEGSRGSLSQALRRDTGHGARAARTETATTTAARRPPCCRGPSVVSPTVTNAKMKRIPCTAIRFSRLGDSPLSTVGTGSRQSAHRNVDRYSSQWHG